MKTLKLMAIVRTTVEVEEVNEETIAKAKQQLDDEPVGATAFHYFDVEEVQ